MYIDIHCHYVSPELVRALELRGKQIGVVLDEDQAGKRTAVFPDGFRTTLPFFPELIDLNGRLATQERMGIGVQVLSGWNDLYGYQLEPENGQTFCRLTNDTLAADIGKHPDKLRGMGTVPLQSGRLAAEEARYCARSLGVRALQIGTNVDGRNLDEADLDPFWRECQEQDLLVVIHPSRVSLSGRFSRYFMSNLVGNPLETTLAASSMIFGGVFERFEKLKVLLVHGGGFLPYQIGRLDRGYATNRDSRSVAPHPPSAYLSNIYYDTITFDGAALRFLIDRAGSDHILFGTDVPFPIADRESVPFFEEATKSLPVGATVAIASRNAVRLGL